TGIAVLLGKGDGTFEPQINTTTRIPVGGMAVGDLNRDGHPDVVVAAASSNYVFVYLGNGDGTFRKGTGTYLPGGAFGIAIGDVNQDGIPDLVNNLCYVALGKGDGTFRRPAY